MLVETNAGADSRHTCSRVVRAIGRGSGKAEPLQTTVVNGTAIAICITCRAVLHGRTSTLVLSFVAPDLQASSQTLAAVPSFAIPTSPIGAANLPHETVGTVVAGFPFRQQFRLAAIVEGALGNTVRDRTSLAGWGTNHFPPRSASAIQTLVECASVTVEIARLEIHGAVVMLATVGGTITTIESTRVAVVAVGIIEAAIGHRFTNALRFLALIS